MNTCKLLNSTHVHVPIREKTKQAITFSFKTYMYIELYDVHTHILKLLHALYAHNVHVHYNVLYITYHQTYSWEGGEE